MYLFSQRSGFFFYIFFEKLEKKATGLSQMHVAISEKTLVEKVNNDSINDGRTEAQRVNDLLHQNKQPEDNDDITPNDGFWQRVMKERWRCQRK